MLKKNQKGFIDPLFIIVVILVLAVAGFIYWRISTPNKATSSESSESAQNSPGPTEQKFVAGTADSTTSTYTNVKPAFSFNYPEGWKVKSTSDTSDTLSIAISSPDFKEHDGELCRELDAGMQFHYYVTNDPDYLTPLDQKKKELETDAYVGPIVVKETKLGEYPALQYLSTPGECGYSFTTASLVNNTYYSVSSFLGDTETGDQVSAYRTQYDLLVSSFKLSD